MKIDSPVKRWPGSVTLPEYLTWPQVEAWTNTQTTSNEITAEAIAAGRTKVQGGRQVLSNVSDVKASRMAWVEGICAIVEAWDLKGLPSPVPPDRFPATPAASAANLLQWLIDQVNALFDEAEEAPNA